MAKKAKPVTKKIDVPQFERGICITSPGLYVDSYGIAWWGNPFEQTFRRVR